MRTHTDLRFEKGDPVREYWLAHGEGFTVETRRGRVVGEVVDTVLDPATGRIVSLVVRSSLLGAMPGGTSEVPAERIQAAVPAREAFVVDGAGREPADGHRDLPKLPQLPQLPRLRRPGLRLPARRPREPAAPRPARPGLRERSRPLMAEVRPRLQTGRRWAAAAAAGMRSALAGTAAHVGPVLRETGLVLREAAVAIALWMVGISRWVVSATSLLARRGAAEVRARAPSRSQ